MAYSECIYLLLLVAMTTMAEDLVKPEKNRDKRQTATDKSSNQLIIDAAKALFEGKAGPSERIIDISNLRGFDIILSPEQVIESEDRTRFSRKAVKNERYHWPGGIVPYEMDRTLASVGYGVETKILAAIKHWQDRTCIKFEPYSAARHGRDRLVFQKGSWCASRLGHLSGAQPLYLAKSCAKFGTIVHEIGHTIGWIHEQARPDRDNYVTVNWYRITPNYKDQYKKQPSHFINTYGIPYDYVSIMHYPSNGELSTKDPRFQNKIGQREALSFLDVKLANTQYKCAEKAKCNQKARATCIAPGYIGPKCTCVCPDGSSSCSRKKNTNSNTGGLAGGGTKTVDPIETLVIPNPSGTTKKCWTKNPGQFLRGKNDGVHSDVTPEQCQNLCEQEATFTCKSFDYNRVSKRCFISASVKVRTSDVGTHSYLDFYQMKACIGTVVPVRPRPGIGGRRPYIRPHPTYRPFVRPRPTYRPFVRPRPTYRPFVRPRPTYRPFVRQTAQSVGLCPVGWVESRSKCFKIGHIPRTHSTAENECRRLGGRLISVRTDAEPILDMVKSGRISNRDWWLKGKVRSAWSWISALEKCKYINFEATRPRVLSQKCSRRTPYICEK